MLNQESGYFITILRALRAFTHQLVLRLWLAGGIILYGCHNFQPPTIEPPQPLPPINHIDQAEAYLITVGLGASLHARYGHSFIKIITDQGITRIYNWGMFSFDDPLFGLKFYLGNRQYWVASIERPELIYLYQHIEDRDVRQQKINLSPHQLGRFIDGVTAAIQPEQMFFNYEHFSANCATIPRDILNQALDEYISTTLSSSPATKSYRDYVKDHMAFIPPLGMLLDVVMNSKLDVPITQWDETFYPDKLAEYLTTLPMIDDQGKPHPTINLLDPPTPWVVASRDHQSTTGNFGLLFCLIMLGLITLMILGAISRTKYPQLFQLRWLAAGYRILTGSISVFWGAVSGTLGWIMLISWLFSTHLDMHHNLNLALFYPVDFIFIVWGLHRNPKSNRLYYGIISCHIITMFTLVLLNLCGLIEQNIHTAVAYLLPLQLGFLSWLVLHQVGARALSSHQ